MKREIATGILFLLPVLGSFGADDTYYSTNYLLSAPAAGAAGTTAIHMSSNAVVSWADGYTNVQYGTDVDETWMTPEKALGPAEGTSYEVVALGRGGQITLTFPNGISDRPGADFTVFENAISDVFLELAWVEISSDGTNFVRFPNYSDTPYSIGAYGELYTGWVYGLAGKYRQGYGTPFDLNELRIAYNAQLSGNTDFSPAFATALMNGFPQLDLSRITHVRLIDIVGDGAALDARGETIYDPYATTGSAGFDLDAVGVLHQIGLPQHIFVEPIPNQLKESVVSVNAYAGSGLPVLFEVRSGPASITGSQLTLSNMTGVVELRAFQPGDAVFAPAEDVFADFEMVAPGASNAPLTLGEWAAFHSVPSDGLSDSDEDGAIDFQEFIMGGNPNLGTDTPLPVVGGFIDTHGRRAVSLEYTISRKALGRCRVSGSANLSVWTNTVPRIIEMQGDPDFIDLTIQLPSGFPQHYYRLIFEEQ
jgi:hypothetical protein